MALSDFDLPPKLDLATALKKHGVERAEDLPGGPDKDMWLAYYAEKARRKDPSQPGVAKEALALLAELKAAGRSTGELWSYGYSHRSTLAPARNEESRIVRELAAKPSAEIVENPACPLKVAEVMAEKAITEYVKPVVPKDPVVIEKP